MKNNLKLLGKIIGARIEETNYIDNSMTKQEIINQIKGLKYSHPNLNISGFSKLNKKNLIQFYIEKLLKIEGFTFRVD